MALAHELDWITDGGVTSPAGFVAGATYTGIKTYGAEPRFDLGLLASERPSVVAGVFTQNRVCGAPVVLCRERVARGTGRAVIVNSGCSRCRERRPGLARCAAHGGARRGRARRCGRQSADGFDRRNRPPAADGQDRSRGSEHPALRRQRRAVREGDDDDRHRPKSRALRFGVAGRSYTIGGAVKGSGMVHPNMATVLCFLTTDAAVEVRFLTASVKRAADDSLNMVDVDMDTSTSDTMLLFANGAAGGAAIAANDAAAPAFESALRALTIALARDLARDGEGARTLIEAVVSGAASVDDARIAARTMVSSPLVKTMVTGRDPNLGRVLMALGRSGARMELERTSVWIGDVCAFERGAAATLDYAAISRAMDGNEVQIRADLGLGAASAAAWGCDLTAEYVRINGDYTT